MICVLFAVDPIWQEPTRGVRMWAHTLLVSATSRMWVTNWSN
jgi:hypothetical protein